MYLYVHGDLWGSNDPKVGGDNAVCLGDKALLFKAPVTNQGLTGPFTFVKRISPCDHDHYGLGGAFRSPQFGYVLLLDKPTGGATSFHKIVYAESPDGLNWPTSWPTLVQTPDTSSGSDTSILDVTLTAVPGTTVCDPTCYYHETWWGVFRFGLCDGCADRVGRIKVDRSLKYPRGLRVWILSGGVWKQADDMNGQFSFIHDDVWSGAAPNSIIKKADGTFEVWASINGVSGCNDSCGCNDINYCKPYGTGSQFAFRTITESSLGPVQLVYSLIRCMPSNFEPGRMFPFRIDLNGRSFLYSTTQDRNCKDVYLSCSAGKCTGPLFSDWQGLYLTVTEIGY